MLVISLIFAGLVVLGVNIAVLKTRRFGPVCGIGALSIFLGLPCVILPAVQLNGLLLVLVGLICWLVKAGPRLFLPCSLAAFLVSHAVGAWVAVDRIRDQAELRKEYPSQSLANRLGYEKKGFVGARADKALSKLEDLVEDRIDAGGSRRAFMLRMLHEGTVEDFINSPGFGVGRQIRPRRQYIELPEAEPIPLPAASSDTAGVRTEDDRNRPSPPSEADALDAVPIQIALQEMHQKSVIDFANPQGFGYVRDRDHVAGFQSHRFSAMPKLDSAGPESRRWRIDRLELASLLTHEEPVVYISEHLPRMDELREAPTRPLTSFEKIALETLRQGENLKLEAGPDRILMLGSIRALKQCMPCHSAKRWALLGAFSYVLRRHADPGR
jgi:hypothetical protein